MYQRYISLKLFHMDAVRAECSTKYSNMLGEPGVGFHTHSLGELGALGEPNTGGHTVNVGFAIWDLLLTVAASFIISRIFEFSPIIIFMVLMSMAIFFHWLFCVPTSLNRLLRLI
jgi:hypothetical protein